MKRLMMGFAACVLLTTSCTEQKITETVLDGEGELSFSTGIGKQTTKTAEFTNSALQAAAGTNGVTVYAYQKTGTPSAWAKWFEDTVIYGDSKWTLKESVRFRNQNETKFITYFSTKSGADSKPLLNQVDGKFDAATFEGVGPFPQFTYKVNTASNNQEDLLAGVTVVKAKQTNITLGLRHILSQINFGTVGYTGAHIRIANIQIKGVSSSATYTYGADENGTVPNIIGEWSDHDVTASYSYFNNTNMAVAAAGDLKNNPQANVPILKDDVMTVKRGDIYIFGDGGNAGPGRAETTWYPTDKTNATWAHAHVTNPTGLDNSLMLIPQDLTDAAKVTFEYQITDVDGAYVAGGPNAGDWAEGEFKLDFSTGTTVGTHYMGAWDQNYRYVYLIDFTDFLDGNALTFDVDVEMYPWVNYDNNSENNGGVEIMVAGQPTTANMNAIASNGTWYIASQSTTNPTIPTTDPAKWAQVIRNEVWNLSTYNFMKIEKDQKITLSFLNVIFNTSDKPSAGTPTEIDLTLPDGYTAIAGGDGITVTPNTPPRYTVKGGNKAATATISITNNNKEYSTSATLWDAIKAVDAVGTELIYKGKGAIVLTGMEPTGLTTAGNAFTVKFNSFTIPTVGKSTNGVWTWNATTRTATWTHN